MRYNILESGSSGNCIILEDIFMLDCGLAYSKVKDYLNNIKVIFISHTHGDHLKPSTIKKIAYEKPNIKFLVGNKLVPKLIELGVKKKNIICLELGKWYDMGLFKAKLEYLLHDVPNCCLSLEYKGKKVFYAVDTASLDHIVAKDYDLYLVEGNYESDEELEKALIESNEKHEFNYLYRVRDTHLSQLQAINWLDKNKSANSEYLLIHQHKDKEIKNEKENNK